MVGKSGCKTDTGNGIPKMTPARRPAKKNILSQQASRGGAVRRFNALVDYYYEKIFEMFPEMGSSAGIHSLDAELSRPSPALFERYGRLVNRVMHAVEDLPLQEFGASDLLNRKAFVAGLRQTHLDVNILKRWQDNPQGHLQGVADSIYMLIVRHADDLGPVAEPVLSRLRKVPRHLDSALECIRRPDPLWKELALKSTPGIRGLFTALVDPLARALGRRPSSIRRIADRASEAVDDFALGLRGIRSSGAGRFSIGTDHFRMLVNERLGMNLAPREAVALARDEASRLNLLLRDEARKFHRRKSPSEILEEASKDWEPQGENLLDAYQRMTGNIRKRFQDEGWVTFPRGDRLLVKPVPEFMREQFPTAAYSMPGPLDPDQAGIFWVNDLSGAAKSGAAARAEIAQHFGIELTCAHEAYPGHHLQFIIQNRHPSLARQMSHHAVFYEGWTLWCEEMTSELIGGDPANPWLRLQQLQDALWRAWRIVIDVGLHTGELSYDGACRILMREVGFTRARAQADVNWYTSSPTVPMSYLIGNMELLRLKRRYVDRGDLSLCEFNDWILSFGAIPWRWIEECGSPV
jgi:hypothetical protein